MSALSPQRIRLFFRWFLLASFLLNAAILADFMAVESGSPDLWGYSFRKFYVIGVYGVFLLAHVVAAFVAPPGFYQSNLVFGSLVVFILYSGVEVLFRYYGFGLITPSKVYNSRYWNAHQPNQRFTFRGGSLYVPQEFVVEIVNNSKGYHDREHACYERGQKRPYRIVLMGDSFVEAYQVRREEALHTLLERQLSEKWKREVEVIAVGLSGMGLVWQMDTMLEQVVACYHPDAIISQYAAWFPDRDRPLFRISGRTLSSSDRPENNGREVSYSAWIYNNRMTHAIIWRNLSNSVGFVLYRGAGILDNLKGKTSGRANDNEMSEDMQEVIRKTCETYRSVREKLGFKGIDLKVAIYSSRQAIPYYRHGSAEPPLDVKYEEMMERCLKNQGISFINLSRAFSRLDNVPVDGFHYKGDGHWNPTGHACGAAIISDILFDKTPTD
jgi:hypothetical protein